MNEDMQMNEEMQQSKVAEPSADMTSEPQAADVTAESPEAETAVETSADHTNEEASEETSEEAPNESSNPLSKYSMAQLSALMKQLREITQMMEEAWKEDVNTFKLQHEQMTELFKWNQDHLKPQPETPETDENGNEIRWDPCNGLDSITEEKCLEIFGDGHPIIGVTHSVTLDRLKDVFEDFLNWMHALADYRDANNAYIELIDEKEQMEIDILKERLEKEEDPEKRQKIQTALNEYWNRTYLDFLGETVDEERIGRIVARLSDSNKMQYILGRTVSRLRQMRLSTQFIPEVVKFESTFLPEEYHCCDGVLLMYFSDLIIYCDPHDRHNANRNKALFMVVILDRMIRNQLKPEVKERVMNNILNLEKQFVDRVPKKPVDNRITPPIDIKESIPNSAEE